MPLKNKEIDVSVITLNYKEARLTIECVKSVLLSKKINFEIIIVDNSCSEKDAKALQALKKGKVRVFTSGTNLGCAGGYNLGIHKANGKYIFIINNDTKIFDRLSLWKMFVYLNHHPKVAVLQPKIKSLQKRDYFEYAGAAGGFIDILSYPFCRGRVFNTVEKDVGQYNNITYISWASTCAFFARKNILKKAGLFDPIYFAYAEEVDISLKIWGLGYQIVSFPHAKVYHKGEQSWKKSRGKKTYLIHRNHLILYIKCTPLKDMLYYFPLRIAYEFLSIPYYITHNSNLHIFFVFLSHISIVLLLPIILKKRLVFFKNYKHNNAPIYKGSIVMDYFLQKKKYFSQLDIHKFKQI